MHEKEFMSHLDKVKQTGPATYKACCPAHEDNDPSLAVTFINDGRVLIHCWAGCSPEEVMSAMGLTMSELFPEGRVDHRLKGATPWIAAERRKADKTEDHHRLILNLAKETRAKGRKLTARDLAVEREAFMALKSTL